MAGAKLQWPAQRGLLQQGLEADGAVPAGAGPRVLRGRGIQGLEGGVICYWIAEVIGVGHLGRSLLGEGRTGFVYRDQSATLGKDLA